MNERKLYRDRVKLVVADADERYLDRLAERLAELFGSRIRLVTFTRAGLLAEYMNTAGERVDILLVHPHLLAAGLLPDKNVGLRALLAEGESDSIPDGFFVVDKYQPCDRMVYQLLGLYAETNPGVAGLISGTSATRIISVFSPAGGVGKTAISVGLATRLAELDRAVFYLNLESFASLASNPEGYGNEGFTHVLLGLLTNPGILPLRLEKYKQKDAERNFYYLDPPQCCLELLQLGSEKTRQLLDRLKQMGKYDAVVIDLDAAITEPTLAALELSDSVVLVEVPEPWCQAKIEAFLNQVPLIGSLEETELLARLVPVVNKYTAGSLTDLNRYGLKRRFAIPFFQDLWRDEQGVPGFDLDRRMSNYLHELAVQFLQDEPRGGRQ